MLRDSEMSVQRPSDIVKWIFLSVPSRRGGGGSVCPSGVLLDGERDMWGTSRKRWNPEQADASPLSSKQILSTLRPEDGNGGAAPPLNPTLNPDFNLNSSFPSGLLADEYESEANRWVGKHRRHPSPVGSVRYRLAFICYHVTT